MSTEILSRAITPPSSPLENRGEWAAVESRTGVILPSDYKDYVHLYGTGAVDGFIWIMNPFSTNTNLNLLERMPAILDAGETAKRQFPQNHPYHFFPAPRGLLPFGVTENGDTLFWKTEGQPDNWQVVVNAAREPLYEEFHKSMTGFLAEILARGYVSKIFPEDFPSAHHFFVQ